MTDAVGTAEAVEKTPAATGTEQTNGGQAAPSSSQDTGTGRNGAAETGKETAPAVTMYDDADDDEGGGKAPPARKTVAVQADWPEDWQDRMLKDLGGDAEALKAAKAWIGRRKSPQDVLKSAIAAEQKIRSGEYKQAAPPEDASPEQIAAWRESQGIPKEPTGYKLPAIKGHDWSDADKEIIGQLNTLMHGANARQEHIDAALGFYVQTVQAAKEQQDAADLAAKEAIEDKRRQEYGTRFRGMNSLVNRLMRDPEAMPSGLGEALMGARNPKTGVPLRYDPEFTRWLDDMALSRYGEGGLVTGEESAALNNREAEILKVMREDPDRYWNEGLNIELAQIRDKKPKR